MIACRSRTSAAARTNESATKSTPEAERELEVVEILLRQRRDRHRDTGQVDALVRLHLAADDDAAARAAVLDLLHREPDEAVVDQDVVAGTQHLADHRGRDRQLAVGGRLLADDDHLLVLQQDARRRQVADPELRALQVGDQRERLPALLLHLAHDLHALGVILVFPCERLRRIASTPASTSARTCSWVDETGPMVATIFVLRRSAAMAPH